jgi:hypothetical protein
MTYCVRGEIDIRASCGKLWLEMEIVFVPLQIIKNNAQLHVSTNGHREETECVEIMLK